MKTLITALALVFALATGASMMALTVHGDRAHIERNSARVAGHQTAFLVY
jgi:hypothetical protein